MRARMLSKENAKMGRKRQETRKYQENRENISEAINKHKEYEGLEDQEDDGVLPFQLKWAGCHSRGPAAISCAFTKTRPFHCAFVRLAASCLNEESL